MNKNSDKEYIFYKLKEARALNDVYEHIYYDFNVRTKKEIDRINHY